MPASTSALSTYRPDLAGSMMEFDLEMDRQGFIGQYVLPILPVAKAGGQFGKVAIEQLLENRETRRAPGAGYSRSNWTFAPDTFTTAEHGAEEPIDDNESRLYSEWFDIEQICTARARDVVLRNQEKRVAAAIFNATTWTGAALTTGITNEWDDASNAVPITDVNAARQKVWDGSGLWPNALIINRKVFNNLRECDQILARIAASGAGFPNRARDITRQMLAALFDLDYILVAGSAKNTANEGQSASLSQIWSDEYAMICRLAVSNDIQEPCLGRTFHWDEDGSQPLGVVETYRDESIRSDVVRVRHQVGEKVLYVQCGHLLSNVTT